jgi:hypothetical protein
LEDTTKSIKEIAAESASLRLNQPSPSVDQPVTHWTIAAPFIHDLEQDGEWLIPYVDSNRHHFSIIPRPTPLGSWHSRASSLTSYSEWLTHLRHGKHAVQATDGGVITVFPQLASAVGTYQQLSRKQIPVVAWLFNVGTCQSGLRRWMAQISLRHIDRFVVHSRRECDIYSLKNDLCFCHTRWLIFP